MDLVTEDSPSSSPSLYPAHCRPSRLYSMLIALPSFETEYSLSDFQDLFVSSFDDHVPSDDCIGIDANNGMTLDPMVLSDPESYMYTSTSESDMDCIPVRSRPPVGSTQPPSSYSRTLSIVSLSDMQSEREIALHSPGKLLNTPRDSTRKYEYPFPPNALSQSQGSMLDDLPSSVASTPGLLLPGEGLSVNRGVSVLGLSSLTQGMQISSYPTAITISLLDPLASVSAVPPPCPTDSVSSATSALSSTDQYMIPVANPLPVTGSAPVAIATHPKLSGFRPADVPIPPKLRARSKKSASVSVPPTHAPHLTTSASAPGPCEIPAFKLL